MKKRKKKSGEKYIGIHGQMYKSPAFKTLSPNAVRIFAEMKWRYNGSNNGEISLSIREGAKLCKIGTNKSLSAIMELLHTGLIKIKKLGVFTTNEATEFIITSEKLNNREATNEWRYYPENDGNKIRGKNLFEYLQNLDGYLDTKINVVR